MKYTKLGNTGLDISRLCLGCMNFGDASGRYKWAMNYNDSETIIKQAIGLGINFFDTANIYSHGSSEEYIGKALNKIANRDQIVIATKIFRPMQLGEKQPNDGGLSRKEIITQCEKSLKRLGTDYIDLYIIHRFDPQTPIEETMSALHNLVQSGKVRYIGASTMLAYQFLSMQHIAEKHGFTKFVSMQNHYNLIYREEEREVIPMCYKTGVAITPYSPLATGRLVRANDENSTRKTTDALANSKYDGTFSIDKPIIEKVAEISNQLGISKSQVALSWLLQKPEITSPIIAPSKTSHLKDLVGALDIHLSEKDITELEKNYTPHETYGY